MKTLQIVLLTLALLPRSSFANSIFYKEANAIVGYSKNNEWVGEKHSIKNSIGFEYFGKLSNDYGDYDPLLAFVHT